MIAAHAASPTNARRLLCCGAVIEVPFPLSPEVQLSFGAIEFPFSPQAKRTITWVGWRSASHVLSHSRTTIDAAFQQPKAEDDGWEGLKVYCVKANICRSSVTRQRVTWHVTRHTSYVTRHTSHVTRHTSNVTRHTSQVTRHMSHVTRDTSLVIRHTSHVTRHTSHVTSAAVEALLSRHHRPELQLHCTCVRA